jgi:hypothetical protein
LAAANFQLHQAAASDLAAVRGDISAVRASFEAFSQAQVAFNQELLSALVSLPFFRIFLFADVFVAGLKRVCGEFGECRLRAGDVWWAGGGGFSGVPRGFRGGGVWGGGVRESGL